MDLKKSEITVFAVILLVVVGAIAVIFSQKPTQPASSFVQTPMRMMSEGVVTVCAERRQSKSKSWMETSAGQLSSISRYRVASTAYVNSESDWPENDMCATYTAPKVSRKQMVHLSAWENGHVIAKDSFFVFPDKF